MAVQIGAKPDSGFDDPLGMLKDCHRRIESFLGILCIVAKRAQGRQLDEEEIDAVSSSLRYFRTAGQRHTADEEVSLFPRLRATGNEKSTELTHLEGDHQEAEVLHHSVESLYLRWFETDALDADAYGRLLSETTRLNELYAAHIRVEEEVVFPHAARTLDSQSLAAIGSEFEQRRKIQ